MRWPRAMTRDGRADAARAEHTAYRRWLTLILRCHLRHVFVGLNMRPPRHMLPKAAWPALWVPPPGTRGIRATARPVPHDSAAVCIPACRLWQSLAYTAYARRLFLFMEVCTNCTMSGRIGDRKTAGSSTCLAETS